MTFDGNGWRREKAPPMEAAPISQSIPLPRLRPRTPRIIRSVAMFLAPYVIICASITGLGLLAGFINNL